MSDQTPPAGTVYTYARVSDSDARTGSCSLQWQQDQMQAWIKANGPKNALPFVDNGISGFEPMTKRKQGALLVASPIAEGDTILVAKLDRGFRNVEDYCRCRRKWLAIGANLTSCTEVLDYSTPQGRMMGVIIVAFAECERDTTKGRVKAMRTPRLEHKLRSSTDPLYGRRHVPFGPERKDGSQECRVEPDPKEQWVIGRIVALREQCKSLREIAAELTRGKICTRKGAPWQHSTVQGILDKIELHRAPFEPDYDAIEADARRGHEHAAKNGGR